MKGSKKKWKDENIYKIKSTQYFFFGVTKSLQNIYNPQQLVVLARKEGTMGWLLHYSPKFLITFLIRVGLTTLETFNE